MLKLKTKWFHKWAKKQTVTDQLLLDTIENVPNQLGSTNLGSGLFKVRTPKKGKGKSGGFRTFLVYKESEIALFVYGFAKNEKDNLDKNELKYFKKLSKDLLAISNSEYRRLVSSDNFIEIEEN
ncbi:MAG: type II toxin-antitoxin system RelE/ParE family toxin [Candidatus Marinimicrobia bacterium]|nr:type II toxin-antitoxin system RelE/ParE family toxin [Candidatus Neomarinimicrobiota bacterium]